jgi:AcrR family transcriptional regulator
MNAALTAPRETVPVTVGRRERKKQATRAALSEAALRLALEHGIENVTVEQIADEADVSLRTFFNYFSSKEEAVVAGDAARGEVLVERFRARPASESVLMALRAAVLAFVEDVVHGERLEELRMMRRSPSLIQHQLAAYAAGERALAIAVAERIGQPAPGNVGVYPSLVAATAMAGLRVAMQHWSDGPGGGSGDLATLRETVAEVFALLSSGLDDPAAVASG